MIASRRFSLLAVVVVALFPLFASAATSEVRVLFDVDNNVATGCTVGGMSGVDQVLVTQVSDSDTAANVTQTHRLVCSSGILGSPTDLVTTGWPAGWNASSGMMLVETRIPYSAFGVGTPSTMRVGFDGTRGAGVFSALTTASGNPILFPVTSTRRRAVGSGDDRMIVMDGDDADWGMINALTEGTAGGGASAIKLLKVFGFSNPHDSFIYFNFNLNMSGGSLLAVDDVFTRNQGSNLTQPAPGVLANDQPNTLPLTAAPVTTPEHGLLTLSPDGGFTYIPYNPSATSPDTFEYKAVSGTEQSNTAKVKINVAKTNIAPKVNSATFSIVENSANGSVVGTVTATDANSGDHISFSIISGNTGNAFAINASTGQITVANALAVNFEQHPTFSLTVRGTDDGSPALSDTAIITINVTNANDAPVAVADSYNATEEQLLTVPAAGVLANDTDEDVPHTLTAVLVLAPLHAQSFALNPNGSFNYTGATDYVGTDTFTYKANDGSLDSNIVSVTITIAGVNDPPSFTSGGNINSPEDTPYSAIWATNIIPGPADETGQVLTFNVNNDNNGLFSVQPAIAADGTLSFTPAPNAVGVANVTATLSDNAGGANTSAPANFMITITNVNDAPVLTAGGGSPTFTEDGAAVAVDPAIAVSDLDDTNLESASVTITNLLDSGAEVLAANTGGTAIVANYVAPTLTLTGTDTLANYQQVLRSITYANSSQNPNTTARSISFAVNDGNVNSNTVSKSVAVVAVNDAPVLTAGGTLNYTENGAPAAIDTTIGVTDVDSTTLAGATVQITGNYVNGEDVLSFAPASGITGNFVAASGTLTLSGTASLAAYQTALRNVLYNNTSENPSPAVRTVTWRVDDGGTPNNLSNQPTSTINVTPVNDA
ncbi:MAG TPA: Ig-like domain-containing protein, partial [Thermoanaerobaculia bacterium]|nr:Ig-like domain-containing protein [Thermoanaerobaculia bacterium]